MVILCLVLSLHPPCFSRFVNLLSPSPLSSIDAFDSDAVPPPPKRLRFEKKAESLIANSSDRMSVVVLSSLILLPSSSSSFLFVSVTPVDDELDMLLTKSSSLSFPAAPSLSVSQTPVLAHNLCAELFFL